MVHSLVKRVFAPRRVVRWGVCGVPSVSERRRLVSAHAIPREAGYPEGPRGQVLSGSPVASNEASALLHRGKSNGRGADERCARMKEKGQEACVMADTGMACCNRMQAGKGHRSCSWVILQCVTWMEDDGCRRKVRLRGGGERRHNGSKPTKTKRPANERCHRQGRRDGCCRSPARAGDGQR